MSQVLAWLCPWHLYSTQIFVYLCMLASSQHRDWVSSGDNLSFCHVSARYARQNWLGKLILLPKLCPEGFFCPESISSRRQCSWRQGNWRTAHVSWCLEVTYLNCLMASPDDPEKHFSPLSSVSKVSQSLVFPLGIKTHGEAVTDYCISACGMNTQMLH